MKQTGVGLTRRRPLEECRRVTTVCTLARGVRVTVRNETASTILRMRLVQDGRAISEAQETARAEAHS